MLIRDDQTDRETLAGFGAMFVELLVADDYRALAGKFEYALAYGRETSDAIEADFRKRLAEIPGATCVTGVLRSPIGVKYFVDDELFALVQCDVETDGDGTLLVELIVIGSGEGRGICLEDFTARYREAGDMKERSRGGLAIVLALLAWPLCIVGLSSHLGDSHQVVMSYEAEMAGRILAASILVAGLGCLFGSLWLAVRAWSSERPRAIIASILAGVLLLMPAVLAF